MKALNTPFSSQQAFIVRLLVGALFGVTIAYLTRDFDVAPPKPSIWRETLSVTLAFIAFVIWAGAGAMRRVSLGIWTFIAFILIGYIVWCARTADTNGSADLVGTTFLVFPLLFIAHELVSSADQADKWIAPYETYFDEAWKRGVQLALALMFTMLFWGILWLGAALLGFIGFDWLKDLLREQYFAMPITGLAFGTAVHLGDVQTKLLANVRSLILGVLAWLLPVITLIGAIFAVSLAFSGLAPLWATKAATATLLSACIGFVLLVNAAYQQGDIERPIPVVLKWCVRGAAILLLIFAVLAVWSLGLRIGQYGLSAERVFAGLGVLIALAYGIGYTIAVFVPGRWMGTIEPLNIGLAVFKCVLFIAILTPIATPNRLSVNDQVSRLISGKVSVADFDWWLLKDDTGVYGQTALEGLAASSNVAIATKAKLALENKIGERPYRDRDSENQAEPIASRADIAAIPVVFPVGGKLPDSFLSSDFARSNLGIFPPACLRIAPKKDQLPNCKAALLDLNQDGDPEILIREGPNLSVFAQFGGVWMGNSAGYVDMGASESDFDSGKIKAAPPEWNDIMIANKRLPVRGFQVPETGLTSSDIKEAPASSPKR